MMRYLKPYKTILIIVLLFCCSDASATFEQRDSIIYQTNSLVIRQLSPHVYEHISYLQTKDFGNVGCNGMLVMNDGEGIIFDTPADDSSSAELIRYVKTLNIKIKAVIATHFHEDCVGGLKSFEENNIPAYASDQTIRLLKKKQHKNIERLKSFDDSMSLAIGGQKVEVKYFGEGHTKDNVVGYYAPDRALFGGCLIKEVGATKGNLEDANVNAWSATVRKVKQAFPQAKMVIPGHGQWGGTELLDYTIGLFE